MKILGCVSYLNSRPLVYGLDGRADLKVIYDVPSRLLDLISAGRCDLALLPVIDYQQRDDLWMVPVSCIGADGHVYTVRLFSRVPADRIKTLFFDTDSHTSVALCRIILKYVYGCEPEPATSQADADATLLIGDKVVCAAPAGHPHQLDLAYEWKQWTGLPFVFAVWMSRSPEISLLLYTALADALREGMGNIDAIVQEDAIPRGWSAEVARSYLTSLLRFDITLDISSPQRLAIERFYQLAHEMGLIDCCRAINVARPTRGS